MLTPCEEEDCKGSLFHLFLINVRVLLQVFCRVLGSVVDPARPSTASYATWDTILRRMAMRGLLCAGHVAMRGLLCTGHVYGASFLRDHGLYRCQ